MSRDNLPNWYCVELRGVFLGRVFCTLDQLKEACGPYTTITGNLANIWGPHFGKDIEHANAMG